MAGTANGAGGVQALMAAASKANAVSAASDRVGKTIGGQIAATIRSHDHSGTLDRGTSGLDDDSISEGANSPDDAADEVAAFRDRKPE